jgi:hypothetical protein
MSLAGSLQTKVSHEAATKLPSMCADILRLNLGGPCPNQSLGFQSETPSLSYMDIRTGLLTELQLDFSRLELQWVKLSEKERTLSLPNDISSHLLYSIH